jgi:hypothetical protein
MPVMPTAMAADTHHHHHIQQTTPQRKAPSMRASGTYTSDQLNEIQCSKHNLSSKLVTITDGGAW